ncbi:hypothetical protein MPH_02000 [Macrophomina phaseolina MS6]|uniref:Uncharacterized protein n=1 Tax=Macrophomina phaseolina (strain MS6) TaxID=1126212 RepID=K2SVM4_MACPH|nr:hypothetical protein MPH_02000 [Macrophomina phaseolina MS6]
MKRMAALTRVSWTVPQASGGKSETHCPEIPLRIVVCSLPVTSGRIKTRRRIGTTKSVHITPHAFASWQSGTLPSATCMLPLRTHTSQLALRIRTVVQPCSVATILRRPTPLLPRMRAMEIKLPPRAIHRHASARIQRHRLLPETSQLLPQPHPGNLLVPSKLVALGM